MKNYKDFEKQVIGYSDVATLIAVGSSKDGVKSEVIRFNKDDSYEAYVVDGETTIPEHYELVAEFKSWVKIYDDQNLTFRASGEQIKIYRAGMMGCIIQVIG